VIDLSVCPPGIYRDVPDDMYHRRRLGLVSKGALVEFERSPLHYRAWLEAPDEDTPALMHGRAFHCALLEPERYVREYTFEPDFGDCRKTANKAARDAWRIENAGLQAIPEDTWGHVAHMVKAVKDHELAGLMIRDGEPEITIAWQDPFTGLRCKTRPDYHVKKRRMCVDVKSTEDASPDQFARSVVKWTYHVQDALYRAGFAAVDEPIDHFVFVAVEKKPPYAVAIHALDEDGVRLGFSRARRAIDGLGECMQSDKWPGYTPTIHTITLPPWAA
jgi:hypothetical protein